MPFLDTRRLVACQEAAYASPRASWYLKSVWIFDFDGTLVDSMRHFAQLASDVIARFHGTAKRDAAEQYRQTSGLPFRAQLEQLYPQHPMNPEAVIAFETAKAERYFDLPPFPETREVLTQLQARGCLVAVSSNNFQGLVEQYIAHHTIPTDLVCGFQPNFAKGEAHFTWIAQQSGYDAAGIVYVGDSLRDAEKARTCGIDFVARAGTFRPAEFQAIDPQVPVIASLKELI